jgi:hypothetical protein
MLDWPSGGDADTYAGVGDFCDTGEGAEMAEEGFS